MNNHLPINQGEENWLVYLQNSGYRLTDRIWAVMDAINKRNVNVFISLFIVAIFGLVACSSQMDNSSAEESSHGQKLNVVATTTIVGDIVSQVGGDLINLSVLLPIGTDPHGFDPTPQDIAKVAEADLVFANGVGLEEFLDNLIESAGAEDRVIYVSDGIDFLVFEDEDHEQDHAGTDPHTWTDPNNVIVWVQNIQRELSLLDSVNAAMYRANAEKYNEELESLDGWIYEQVARIPEESRKLVTDHTTFGYFAEEYGFEQVGTLIQGFSTLAEPTAKEMADIEDLVREIGVNAIFVGNNVNPALAERITEDTGTMLVFVYTGSLSESGGDASTYIEYMRYNTDAFVNALTRNP